MIIPKLKGTIKEKLIKVIDSLAENRKKILSKGFQGQTVFFLGNQQIVLERKQITIGEKVIKL